jgi:putative ABC transport system permease protein
VLLAAIGLYGALARPVTQRSRELGIRVAIGARTHHILATVSAPLALAAGCGLTGGLLSAAAVLRVTRTLLFDLSPVDPVPYAAAVTVILACCAAGAAVPLLRAIRTDPAAALRSE